MDKVRVSVILKIPRDMTYDRIEEALVRALENSPLALSGITFVSCSYEEDLEE